MGNSRTTAGPCGACRQMLYEFAPGFTVLVAGATMTSSPLPLHDLMPHGFGPKDLEQEGG